MLTLAAHLPLVMAAEKSRTAFYIVGGLTAAWAVVLALGYGLRRADFPSTVNGQRIVMAVSAALVIATGAIGVITASRPATSPTHAAPVAEGQLPAH
jgi:hypothetical protein